MRKLYITRKGSLVRSLSKLQVYISDFENSEINICDIPCRKLGDIRDDETVTFKIDNNVNRVFVIANAGTRDACCDSIHIMSGDTNVEVSGKCKFNPARLNSFVFDGEPDAMAKRYRDNANRNGSLKIAGGIVLAAILGIAVYMLPFFFG